MQHIEKMIKAGDELVRLGHEALVTSLAEAFFGKSDKEKEVIRFDRESNKDTIREF